MSFPRKRHLKKNPSVVPNAVSAFCPRCDREYIAETQWEALAVMKNHLELAHPDFSVERIEDDFTIDNSHSPESSN